MSRRRWQDLSDREKFAVLTLGSIQLSLAATAWADLAVRPAEEVNGRKRIWVLIIAINWIGPICYFRWGRRPARQGLEADVPARRDLGLLAAEPERRRVEVSEHRCSQDRHRRIGFRDQGGAR